MQTTESLERERREYHARRAEEIRQRIEDDEAGWAFLKMNAVLITAAVVIEAVKWNVLF